jgi:peptide/nickel transport system substrate-binding protein
MKAFKQRLIAIVIAILAILALISASIITVNNKHTLTYIISSDAVSLDPLHATENISWKIISQIYEGLMKFRPNSLQVEPNLASGYEVSNDGLVYTFYLQKNVYFQDGTHFDADAVIWNVKRAMGVLDSSYYASLVWGDVKNVEKLGQYEVRFTLKYPDSGFLTNLAVPLGGSMVSPHASDPSAMPVGTGPYKLASWEKNKIIVLTYNRSWWQQNLVQPYFHQIDFVVISDATTAIKDMENGQAQILDSIPPDFVSTMYNYPKVQVVETNALMTVFLGFNASSKVFSDTKVRQAVKLLIDRQELIHDVYGGFALPANGPLPPALNRFVICRDVAPNKALALELLKEAGYTKDNPLVFSVEVPLEPRDYLPGGGMKLGEALRKQLEVSGLIRVNFVYKPFEQVVGDLEDEDKTIPDAFILGWSGDNGLVDNFFTPLFHSASPLNFFNYSDKLVDQYLDKAKIEQDAQKQRLLYRYVCEEFIQNPPAVFLSYPFSYKAIDYRIKGFNINPLSLEQLYLLHY